MNLALTETKKLLPVTAILFAIMLIVGALAQSFTWQFVLSAILGTIMGLLLFFMTAVTLSEAVKKDPKGAAFHAAFGYFVRLSIIGITVYLCTLVDFLRLTPYVVALFFPKLAIYINTLLIKKEG